MFVPNLYGTIENLNGYNVNAERIYSAPLECPYATVNMMVSAQKTSVRADSSASRGAADERAAERAVVLIPTYINVFLGDRFTNNMGQRFGVKSIHLRYSVGGQLDHYEVALEVIP